LHSAFLSSFVSRLSSKNKSFPFSALTLLRRLFFLAARQSLQADSALAPLRQFRFPTPSENRKTKVFRFPLSVFRFYVYLCARKKIFNYIKYKVL